MARYLFYNHDFETKGNEIETKIKLKTQHTFTFTLLIRKGGNHRADITHVHN